MPFIRPFPVNLWAKIHMDSYAIVRIETGTRGRGHPHLALAGERRPEGVS